MRYLLLWACWAAPLLAAAEPALHILIAKVVWRLPGRVPIYVERVERPRAAVSGWDQGALQEPRALAAWLSGLRRMKEAR